VIETSEKTINTSSFAKGYYIVEIVSTDAIRCGFVTREKLIIK